MVFRLRRWLFHWFYKSLPVSNNCGYEPRNEFTKKGKVNKRAKRIEWEHVVPA